ncbi:MAG TPA: 3-oxoacyl-ACP reductase FabG [Mycobacteriales bacterium]|jgi:3-oxoacyl-[acyl-carrier protein] reductase|nr:3-oxoacyl-ACP reductase FabG [Mycobacteriales bacterium]
MRLQDKSAIITGAGSGIGRATAHTFAGEGALVGVADIDGGAAEQVANEIEATGGTAVALTVNVGEPDSVAAAFATFLEASNSLDVLINCAGINRDGFAKTLSSDDWDLVLNVNLKGTFLTCQAALATMTEQKSGSIINTASIAVRGNIGQANYAASKSGIIGLTRTLALEGARYGVRVNCVSPGPTKTPMAEAVPEKIKDAIVGAIPLRRMAEPSEIAAAFLFLASDEASFITGEHIFCDGGINIGVM